MINNVITIDGAKNNTKSNGWIEYTLSHPAQKQRIRNRMIRPLRLFMSVLFPILFVYPNVSRHSERAEPAIE